MTSVLSRGPSGRPRELDSGEYDATMTATGCRANSFFHRRLVPRAARAERVLSPGECAAVAVVRGTAFREGRFGFLVAFPLVSAARDNGDRRGVQPEFTRVIHASRPPLSVDPLSRAWHHVGLITRGFGLRLSPDYEQWIAGIARSFPIICPCHQLLAIGDLDKIESPDIKSQRHALEHLGGR